MGTINIFELVMSLRKRIAYILIAALLCGYLLYSNASSQTTCTAAINLEYKNYGADQGKAPDGTALNVYEIMNPNLISSVLQLMDSDYSVELVRNNMTITEVLDTATSQMLSAKLEKGEEFTYHATEFRISMTYPGGWGTWFGRKFLYYLAEGYDRYFSQKYYKMETAVNFFTVTGIDALDYTELCSVIDGNLTTLQSGMERLQRDAGNFRSYTTGMTFKQLAEGFTSVRTRLFEPYNANVQQGLLTKDIDKLLASYQSRINTLAISAKDSGNNTDSAYQLLEEYYKNFGALYQQAAQSQTALGVTTGGITVIQDYDPDKLTSTYDKLMTNYVDQYVESAAMQHDIAYYQGLMKRYQNDDVPADTKAMLLEKNEKLLAQMRSEVAALTSSAQSTLDEYYQVKAASDIDYLMNASVYTNSSAKKMLILGVALGAIMAAAFFIVFEMFRTYLDKRKTASALPDFTDPDFFSRLSGPERALYEQSEHHFEELTLQYQPRVDKDGKWRMAECLIRWQSKRFGVISPDELMTMVKRLHLEDKLSVWTLSKACAQLIEWETQGVTLPVCVNCSVQQVTGATFLDALTKALADSSVKPERLWFEISGGGEITDYDYMKQKLRLLRSMGCRVAIDRFGDEISSLRVLYELPIDMLVISRKYVASLADVPDPFLSQTIGLCKERGVPVCVLGVETRQQQRLLLTMGVQYLQGYYFARVLTPGQIAAQMK